jgi:hypothetical protein
MTGRRPKPPTKEQIEKWRTSARVLVDEAVQRAIAHSRFRRTTRAMSKTQNGDG